MTKAILSMPVTDIRGALLVGSMPLADSAAVFTFAAQHLGRHLKRIPDGETVDRLIGYFAKHTGRLGYYGRLRSGRSIGSNMSLSLGRSAVTRSPRFWICTRLSAPKKNPCLPKMNRS